MGDVIHALMSPLGVAWVGMCLAGIWLARKREVGVGMLLGLLALLLSILGGSPLPALLLARLEQPHVPGVQLGAEGLDAVLVLGGGWRSSSMERPGFQVDGAFDRIITGMLLVEQGRARHLVLGGGGGKVGDPISRDSEAVRPWVGDRLGAACQVHVLGYSRNTRDEVVQFAELARVRGWRRVGLVTSAWHLDRARRALGVALGGGGVEVLAVGCDFAGGLSLREGRGWTVVPTAGTLEMAGQWIHEVVGLLYYRILGWA